MARPIWSGSITFGLVSVPVRLYPATESKELVLPEGVLPAAAGGGREAVPVLAEGARRDGPGGDRQGRHPQQAAWDPARYHDRYRGQLLDLLQKKAEGEELPELPAEPEGEVVDLMEALRKSVQATSSRSRERSRKSSAAKKTSKRKKTATRKAS